jgi:hypothetical protein
LDKNRKSVLISMLSRGHRLAKYPRATIESIWSATENFTPFVRSNRWSEICLGTRSVPVFWIVHEGYERATVSDQTLLFARISESILHTSCSRWDSNRCQGFLD